MLKNQTRFTTPVNLIVGLDVSLKMLLAGGLDAVYRKQWALTMFTRAAVKAMGLELLAPDDFAWGITSVLLPEGVDGNEVLRLATTVIPVGSKSSPARYAVLAGCAVIFRPVSTGSAPACHFRMG